ncbi:hypothetical protein FQN60_011447 [Etheostoma spectabile]|uniref:Uncharacterized protein n=1 Tax=Etheostoma spectabile TaxID=54343 RepID=A0A5J5DS39_9PERO|nr:hypothetical protein FQN60_011447 [Etheostoma spectabile]
MQPTWSVQKYRCSVLRDMARNGQEISEDRFSKVLWTDEMRVTLDGPDGGPVAGSLMGTELHFESDASRGSGVLVWAAL